MTVKQLMTVGAVGLAVLGCRGGEPASEQGPFFAPEGETRSVQTLLATQQARGAAADGTLYAAHFDGAELNALGRQKLDAIVNGSGGSSAVRVYLDLEAADAHRESVNQYLSEAGVAAERIEIAMGDNPRTRHLASLDAGRLYTVEEGRVNGVASEAAPEQTTSGSMVSQTATPRR